MNSRAPLVVAILHSDESDINYQLYTQCYGLEMQIDDEWNAELVLLAPYENFAAVVDDTSVTGEDTAIVSAGVTDLPAKPGGGFDTASVTTEQDNWVLVGDPRRSSPDPRFNDKLNTAIGADCRVVICIDDLSPDVISERLGPAKAIDGARVIVAITHAHAMKPAFAANAAKEIRAFLGNADCAVVVAGKATAANISKLVTVDGINGVFLTDADYDEFTDILGLLRTVGG